MKRLTQIALVGILLLAWASMAAAQARPPAPFGGEFRYQKSLFLHMQFEERKLIDGNTMDDRANCTNPGGANVFGTAASEENPGFRIQQLYIDYRFVGTPLRLRVGADLWSLDPSGLIGRHDPRAAVIGEFGDLDVLLAAVIKR